MLGTARQPAHGTYYQKRRLEAEAVKSTGISIWWSCGRWIKIHPKRGEQSRCLESLTEGGKCVPCFFCVSSFWWSVFVFELWCFFLILMTCLPWSSFSCFFFILMMCVNPWCWAGPVRRSWIIYQKFIFTIPRLFFSTYISTFAFFKRQIHINIIIWISTMQCCSSAPCKECKSQQVTQFLKRN